MRTLKNFETVVLRDLLMIVEVTFSVLNYSLQRQFYFAKVFHKLVFYFMTRSHCRVLCISRKESHGAC